MGVSLCAPNSCHGGLKRLQALRRADQAAGLPARQRMRINAIVVTHFDLDHYYGLIPVLHDLHFEIGRLYHNGQGRTFTNDRRG